MSQFRLRVLLTVLRGLVVGSVIATGICAAFFWPATVIPASAMAVSYALLMACIAVARHRRRAEPREVAQ